MHLSPFDSAVRDRLSGLTNNLFHARMSRPDASHQAIGRIYNLMKTQASTEAYLDTPILAIICFYILLLMILVKKPTRTQTRLQCTNQRASCQQVPSVER